MTGVPATTRRASVWVLGGLLALVAFVFREFLFDGAIFYRRDILLVWYPQVEAFVRSFAAGSWPVWNPSLGFGQPLLADPSAQVAYPPTWLNLLIRPWHYYTAYVVGHVVLSAGGLFALARRWSLSVGGAGLAAALWVLSGPYLSFIDLWHHFAGASWLPLTLLAADRALWSRTRRDGLLWAAAESLQILAGSADMCALSVVLTGGLVLRHVVKLRPFTVRLDRGLVGTLLLASLVAAGLTAVLWMPALDIVTRAARSRLPDAVRTYWSVHPLVLLETVIPGLFSALPLAPEPRATLFESREPLLSSLYLGGPLLGLVAAAFAGPRHPLRVYLGLFAALAMVTALGRHGGAYDLVMTLAPPLRILRYPVKVMIAAALCWCLLAGIGFDVWRRADVSVRRLAMGVGLSLFVLAALDFSLALGTSWTRWGFTDGLLAIPAGMSADQVMGPVRTRLALAGSLVAIACLLALAGARWRGARLTIAAALAVLGVVDLAAYHRHPSLAGPLALARHRPEVLDRLGDVDPRIYVYDYSAPGKTRPPESRYALARQPEGWDPDAAQALGMQMYVAPESGGRWGLRGSYDVDYRGLFAAPLDDAGRRLRASEGTPAHLQLLRLGGVTHVLALHDEAFVDLSPVARLPGLFREPIRLFRVPSPLPRAFAVGGWRVTPVEAALGLALAPDFEPAREVVLSEGGAVEPPPDFRSETRIAEARSDLVRIESRLSAPGCVVLLDSFDPGWQARVDGRPETVLTVNGMFRGVKVGPGSHDVVFTYRPRAILVGLASSASTLLLVVALMSHEWRGSRKPIPPGAVAIGA